MRSPAQTHLRLQLEEAMQKLPTTTAKKAMAMAMWRRLQQRPSIECREAWRRTSSPCC